MAILKYYRVDSDGKIKRLRRECPSETCGPSVMMAQHADRQYCGKCGLTVSSFFRSKFSPHADLFLSLSTNSTLRPRPKLLDVYQRSEDRCVLGIEGLFTEDSEFSHVLVLVDVLLSQFERSDSLVSVTPCLVYLADIVRSSREPVSSKCGFDSCFRHSRLTSVSVVDAKHAIRYYKTIHCRTNPRVTAVYRYFMG